MDYIYAWSSYSDFEMNNFKSGLLDRIHGDPKKKI